MDIGNFDTTGFAIAHTHINWCNFIINMEAPGRKEIRTFMKICLFMEKKMLAGSCYNSRNALASTMYTEKYYSTVFRSWIPQMEKCFSVKGKYFEGLV